MIELVETPNRPLLRVLKLAAKLHKAGLTADETVQFIINCRNDMDAAFEKFGEYPSDSFPSAAASPTDILIGCFVWADTVEGNRYWLEIYRRIGGTL